MMATILFIIPQLLLGKLNDGCILDKRKIRNKKRTASPRSPVLPDGPMGPGAPGLPGGPGGPAFPFSPRSPYTGETEGYEYLA